MFFIPFLTTFAAARGALGAGAFVLAGVETFGGEKTGAFGVGLVPVVTGVFAGRAGVGDGFAVFTTAVSGTLGIGCGDAAAGSSAAAAGCEAESGSGLCVARFPKYRLSVRGIVNSNPYLSR